MGNQGSSVRTKSKHGKKMTKYEAGMLDQMFHEMAVRSPDDVIAKDTFLKFFDLPGVLGDRLFEVFDTKKTGNIDFEEFIDGYQRFSQANPTTKMDTLFQLFDLDGKGGITKMELRTVLMSIVIPPNQVMHDGNDPNNAPKLNVANARLLSSNSYLKLNTRKASTQMLTRISADSLHTSQYSDSLQASPKKNDMPQFLPAESNGIVGNMDVQDETIIDIDEVQARVECIVNKAFQHCDVDASGRLDATEFRTWLQNNPEVMQACDELFVQLAWNGPMLPSGSQFDMEKADAFRFDSHPSYGGQFLQCDSEQLRFVSSADQIPKKKMPVDSNTNTNNNDSKEECEYVVLALSNPDSKLEFTFCPCCGKKLTANKHISVRTDMNASFTDTKGSVAGIMNFYEGQLYMAIGKFRQLKTRYVRLHGKFLYIYKNEKKHFPDTIVFIQGYFVELTSNPKFSHHSYLRLNPPPGSTGKPVHLYCENASGLASVWLDKLEVSAQTTKITKYYDLGKSIGKGSFAKIVEATEKTTQRKVAVKIIEKKVIDGKQKEYIRIELSVMKLVVHPNVMRLEQVFETKSKIYMVMPMYTGGDLYDYMKHNARHGIKEDQSRRVIWNVLSALKYLHSVGIVHRDLKPENLLLKRKLEPTDIVITDFGLSKFAAPHEAMKAACGTLSYVAPEVLRMEGYGKEVDLWSTGVIMFLTLRAKLPFHDTTKNKIIARILRQGVQMVDPNWQKISKEAKDLITQLLTKNPNQRITCEEAMKHPWFEPIREQIETDNARRSQTNKSSLADSALGSNDNVMPLSDKYGGSVRHIKVYNDGSGSGYGDAEVDSDFEEDGMPRMALIKQNSVVNM